MIAVVHAVFDDGPLGDRPSILSIADDGRTAWPPQCEWTARHLGGPSVHYTYIHVGMGHYRLARSTRIGD